MTKIRDNINCIGGTIKVKYFTLGVIKKVEPLL